MRNPSSYGGAVGAQSFFKHNCQEDWLTHVPRQRADTHISTALEGVGRPSMGSPGNVCGAWYEGGSTAWPNPSWLAVILTLGASQYRRIDTFFYHIIIQRN